jgi:hypothetical protein
MSKKEPKETYSRPEVDEITLDLETTVAISTTETIVDNPIEIDWGI